MPFSSLKREDFPYQPYYCEENIWQLCQHEQFKNSLVVFIASKGDTFPMLNQRAMKDPAIPILWDYHVILIAQADRYQVLDFDTTLPFPVDIKTYLSQSFIDNALLDDALRPWFKIVPAGEYVASFCSDRRHMKTEEGWLAPPPDWPTIGRGHNLSRYTDMTDTDFGEVLDYNALLTRFG